MRTSSDILKLILFKLTQSTWARSWQAREWLPGLAAWQVDHCLEDYRAPVDLEWGDL
jgi:hypothetical protein